MKLTAEDRRALDGERGEAARFALSVVVRMAEAAGAEELLSIEQAHIDACALMSRSSLDLVSHLAEHGGRVRVPTTLSMVSLDLEGWKSLGVSPRFAATASRIAQAYLELGCIPTWTCAPYQGYLTPRFGQQIAWGESNAVAYANSVLGARTNRYPDYLDICAAITGRVPYAGLHRTENRRATVHVHVERARARDWETPAAWAAFGSLVGSLALDGVPVMDGLPAFRPSNDMLKAFGAAAASSGSIELFHMVGITPEAADLATAGQGRLPSNACAVARRQLADAWDELSGADAGSAVDAVILGCPHVSYAEFAALSEAIARFGAARIHPNVQFLVFAGATTVELARRGGLLGPIERWGARIVRDTCPFHSPVVAPTARVIATDSGKCAYYAPGELDVRVAFGTLDACVEAGVKGRMPRREAPWRAR
ncbi:MAG: aconitase X catalytic domain-containing protein [Candidatus Bipolaricaulis sp.]|nr:aconitase X catalytic domain-containing protein [Candidatus Bipolaricaulis sp.]